METLAAVGVLIGEGNTADVYGLDLPVVKSYQLVRYRERYGILYDRVDGQSMLDLLLDTRDLHKYATALALSHKKLLARGLQGAVTLKSIIRSNIEQSHQLNLSCQLKLVEVLDSLPDGNNLCHGDFHFGNVLVSGEQHYIIDYMNVCRGHRYGDIARTVYLIEMTPAPAQMDDHEYMMQMKKRASEIYLGKMGVSKEELSDWLVVTCAARLAELDAAQEDEKNTIINYLEGCGLLLG